MFIENMKTKGIKKDEKTKELTVRYFKTSKKAHTQLKQFHSDTKYKGFDLSDVYSTLNNFEDSFKDGLVNITSNINESLNYLIEFVYEEHNESYKMFLWTMLGGEIYKTIAKNKNYEFDFPIKNDEGDVKYLQQRFKEVHLNVQ